MKIRLTQFALDCLKEIESFGLVKGYSPEQAAEFVESLLIRSARAIENSPTAYRYSPRLTNFGLKMRERLDESSHWCFYKVTDDTILIMLFVHSKQDLKRALYRHQIIRD